MIMKNISYTTVNRIEIESTAEYINDMYFSHLMHSTVLCNKDNSLLSLEQSAISSHQIDIFEAFPRFFSTNNTFPRVD